jgi:flagellar biosynthetic protein FliQ
MSETDIADVLRMTGSVILTMAGPLLAAALIVGLLVAILQAVTQINEATLVFIPKVLSIGATLFILGLSMFETLGTFTRQMIDRMAAVGGS